LKQHSYKNADLKETIPTLREFIYLNVFISLKKFIKRNAETEIESEQSLNYLPSKDSSSSLKYTLVLDLDETLVHYVEDEESAYILIRPGAENFLEELSKYYELVIFTAATQDVQ
jgi:CTD small phosphatase-like protein 2